ncbi:hypothetical protein OF364_02625 [Mycoplasma enhydrae]|uniref:Vmc-like lipoprotein signal peptide domain-containing protein n=1 Tax=Mycoplasma enhydrae TaxID=2499220 RepID=UPI00197B67EC|nr:hypothetical protein [Mycoplasma enhydrae]MBN4089682.1 hypothetical protein [Mycoplasma enhydrae]MCV3733927.1 hypothetical protein [Mycoplasma enhydrae]MCV3753702.1 hypothetical protein [Mycoplasma enhydrae]
MKKNKKILFSLMGVASAAVVPLAAVSCSNTAKKEFEKTLKKVEDKIKASKLEDATKKAWIDSVAAAKKVITDKGDKVTDDEYKAQTEALNAVLKLIEEAEKKTPEKKDK